RIAPSHTPEPLSYKTPCIEQQWKKEGFLTTNKAPSAIIRGAVICPEHRTSC
ncbi:hypothetical protein CEXT_618081, partial [Caerostris extrusa]